MRHQLCLSALLLLFTSPSLAHPGDGIVADSKGNVYFTDLKHVWKVTPGGMKSIVVRDQHTHELFVDEADNVYGEDSHYDTQTKKWSHSLWKLSADGKLTTVRASRPGFREDVSFVRDHAGNQHFLRPDGAKFRLTRKPAKEVERTLVRGLERSALRQVGADGNIYLTQGDKLLQVSPNGSVRTVASGLTSSFDLEKGNEGLNILYGLTVLKDGTVYLAYFGGRKLLKVTQAGQASVVYRAGERMSPTGVTTFRDTIYVLESGVPSNPYAVKVVKIEPGKAPVTIAETNNAP